MDHSLVAALAALLAADREAVIIRAFWTLVGAGAFVSLGAWLLLRREIRQQRRERGDGVEGSAS
jgi:hypothetical protein